MSWEANLNAAQPFAIGGVLLLIYVAEHVWPQRRELIDYRHDASNFAVGCLNAAVIFGSGYFFQKVMNWYNELPFGVLNIAPLPRLLRIASEITLVDFLMYWWHRANHRWAPLWRFHRFHHEDTKLNSTSALRFHPVELSLSYLWRLVLFPLLGISKSGFALYGIVFSAIVIFHHSGIRIGRRIDAALRFGFVTPLMHRIHHSVVQREADSNYGSVLPWWDWIFGSYTPRPVGAFEFGVK